MTPATDRVRIRKYAPADCPTVVRIDREAYPESSWTVAEVRRIAKHPSAGIWMAEDAEDGAVGFAVYSLLPGLMQVNSVAVAKAARGRRLGERLLMGLAGGFLTAERPDLIAVVPETNLTALRFCRSCGLSVWRTDPVFYRRLHTLDADAVWFRYRPRRLSVLTPGAMDR